MTRTIRIFLFAEAVTFAVAALIHSGRLIGGAAHREAMIAEGVIAIVLLGGLALSWIRPASTRAAGLGAQGFALFWTLVGIFTIVIGIGPRTVPDIVYHVVIVAVLIVGLVTARRARPPVRVV